MGLRLSKGDIETLVRSGATLGPSVQLPRADGPAEPCLRCDGTILWEKCCESGCQRPAKTSKGRGIRRQLGEMNKTERLYGEYLGARKADGEIVGYWFDCVKLRLAAATFYTPDFFVMLANGELEVHEVKGGFIEDDAIVKLKVAAAMYPFRFWLCQKKKAKAPWVFKEIG